MLNDSERGGDGAQTYLPRPVSIAALGVIFMVHHGQCRSNTESPIQDYRDCIDPLTDEGRAQSRACGHFLSSLLPKVRWRLYSSALQRAIETANIIAGLTSGVVMATDPRLNEFSSKSETHLSLLDRLNAFLSGFGAPVAGGERVVVVTHGHVLECFLSQALDAPIQVIDEGGFGGQAGLVTHANGGVSTFYRGELILWNAHAHLLT